MNDVSPDGRLTALVTPFIREHPQPLGVALMGR
jgi:hypothetical protein